MFNVLKRLHSGEMSSISSHEILAAAKAAAKVSALEGGNLTHVEARSEGWSRIIEVFDMRPKELE